MVSFIATGLVIMIGITFFCLLFCAGFFKFIYAPYKIQTEEISFVDLMSILNMIINTVFDLYNRSVFMKKTALDNAAFENYLVSICADIDSYMSESFKQKLLFYFTEDALYEIITKTVKVYLEEKI